MTRRSEQVVVWAPRGRDAVLAVALIERHGFAAQSVGSIEELLGTILEAGCAVIASEALSEAPRQRLVDALAAQPPWSDFPIVLFAPQRLDRSDEALEAVKVLGNVSILERPVHSSALISALTAALRGRRRQYEARDAIHRRDQFLAMLGHELRNPLAAITLAIETLPRTPGAPGERQRAIIDRQTRHLARLVDDLLDVARVTSGKVRLTPEPLDLTTVVERCVHGAELAARSRKIDLRFEPWPQPLQIEGDLVRMEEIFNNLISNALKYSPEGARVTVQTQRQDGRCQISVVDTGMGIDPDMLGRVFDLFAQADGTLDRSQGGLGIGLTLVRSLVHLHGGTITASSEGLGHGSRFVVDLPLSSKMPRATQPHLTVVPHAMRVLLVEDNPDLLEMTKIHFEISGCEVTTAVNGRDGLAVLLASPPDVAFIDIGIPLLDGYGVARQARAANTTAYLVAMTGYGQPEDHQRSVDAGFDRHVTKPVTAAMLREVLAAAANRATERVRSVRR